MSSPPSTPAASAPSRKFLLPLDIDEIFARKRFFASEVDIRQTTFIAGDEVKSPAGGVVYYVKRIEGGWRCYLYSDDGTMATRNWFGTDDQVISYRSGIEEGVHENVSNKRWWRRAMDIGKEVIEGSGDDTQYQYVDISETDCEAGSDVPEAGDRIATMGNWTNKRRQGVILITIDSEKGPCLYIYRHVGAGGKHFSLPAASLASDDDGVVIYGEFHSIKDNSTTPGEDDKSIDEQIRDLAGDLNSVKEQGDKRFEIHFGYGEPTADTTPAVEWTTDEEKELHVQDIYYDRSVEAASEGGRAWRWIKTETGAYGWQQITDQDTNAALQKIADVASDSILTGGAEKSRVYIEWMKAGEDYVKYMEQAGAYGMDQEDDERHEACTAYQEAWRQLCRILNDDNTLPEGDTPAWLEELTESTVIPDARAWRAAWEALYTTRAALRKAIAEVAKQRGDTALETANSAQESASEKMRCFVTEPVPPYKPGDLWIQDDGNVMICVTERTEGYFDGDDWTDLSDMLRMTDAAEQLLALALQLHEAVGSDIRNGSIKVFLTQLEPDGDSGWVWFDGTTVCICNGGHYVPVANEELKEALQGVRTAIGERVITVYGAKPETADLYDLVVRTVTFHDRFRDEDVEGNVEVLTLRPWGWQMLQDATRAIIENLGDELRLVVFGSDGTGATDASGLITRTMFNDLFSQKVTVDENGSVTNIDRSGLVTTADFSTLFAEQIDENEDIVKRADISVFVTKDEDGVVESGIRMAADQIDFIGKTTINGNFVVDMDGNVTMKNCTVRGTVYAQNGKIGPFSIGEDGIYVGDYSKWWTNDRASFAYLNSSSLLLEQQVGYFSAGDTAHMMIGLGRGSDPTSQGDQDAFCASAMYIYRKMNSATDYYRPAAQIISDNVFSRNIALRLKGGLQVHGGVIQKGSLMRYTSSGDANILDLSRATAFILYNSYSQGAQFFYPTLTEIRQQLGITDTSEAFCVPFTIVVARNSPNSIYFSSQCKSATPVSTAEGGIIAQNDGNEWKNSMHEMASGDAAAFALVYTPATGYYCQLMSTFA